MAKKSQNAFAAKNWMLVVFATLLLIFGLVFWRYPLRCFVKILGQF